MKGAPLKRNRPLQASKGLRQTRPLNKCGKRGQAFKKGDAANKKNLIAIRGESCERCEYPKSDLHHVRTKGSHPELRNLPANHCLLCRKCHVWIGENPKEGRNWFRQYRPYDAEIIGIGKELEA